MPAVRKREGDIRLLVEHFARRSARKLGNSFRGIDPEALRRLEAYAWPGNVRELQNVIERSVIVCESEKLTLDPSWRESDTAPEEPSGDSPSAVEGESRASASASERGSSGAPTLEDVQCEAIVRALRSCNWVIGGPRGAAAQLGLKRTTLQARMKKLGIAPPRPVGGSTPVSCAARWRGRAGAGRGPRPISA